VLFREPTPWQRYRTVVLITLALITAEALLIGLLLLERRRRKLAQLALDDQAAYEQMMAKLTADAAHHSLDNASRGLDAALARVATYAHASAAMLVEYSETRLEPLTRIFWPNDGEPGAPAVFTRESAADEAQLEIPLTADGSSIGTLVLRRSNNAGSWTPKLVNRIEAASEIIASALARSRAARAIEEARRQVAHMARVALVGELAATMSHELRQPLAAIRANAEAGALLLARSPNHSPEAREIFQHIVADDARAVEVIEGVRRLLRKDERVAKAIDLNEVCRDAVRLLENDARIRHTRLALSLAPTVPLVMGDPVQLRQAVLNLALNGLEAASTSATERSVLVETASCGGHVEVAVHDSGPGIPASVAPHLFESFFSTKDSGLGLGLVIVRSIVERHNGRVRADSGSLGGAVFRVRLPAVHGADPAPTGVPHSDRELARETVARE
jgi:signal transduction histidine kinase